MNSDVPFHILKNVITIRDSKYSYKIDENGHGIGFIENYRVTFDVDEYNEVVICSIRCFLKE